MDRGASQGWKASQSPASIVAKAGQERSLDWKQLITELIDLRSFSNLWYWIALAVTWSQASHWVIGVPFDMVMRARRIGGEATRDLDDMTRVCVNRILYIHQTAGVALVAVVAAILTCLGLLGFVYQVEFCQAVFLIAFPLSLVGILTLRTASRIAMENESGEALMNRLKWHRRAVQGVGMVSIFLTAMWGMFQNLNITVLPY